VLTASKKYRVIVVGAGPAGLFACYELLKKGIKKILLIDKGKKVAQRTRQSDIMCGVGGAGLFSDGKLMFTPKRGKTDLTQFLPFAKAQKIVNYLEKTFSQFGMDGKVYPPDLNKAKKLKIAAQKLGMNLLIIKQKHLGSDFLPQCIQKLENYLLDHGLTILSKTLIKEIATDKKKVIGVITEKNTTLKADFVVLAPGRWGSSWLLDQFQKLNLNLDFQPIEVGVRVEVPASIITEITNIIYDPPIFFYSKAYDDLLQTFCVNPTGLVAREEYKNFICVNGHAYRNSHSLNGNFALLNRINLSEPLTNTIRYGESICELANTIGAGKPLIQRWKDFRHHRRSNWRRIHKNYIEPTLTDVTPGDISMALPHRVVINLSEGLERLNKLIPGVASDSTLLYAPEVKFYSVRPKINKQMETEIKNLFVAGDGAGVSGNIIGAAATGVIAAREIASKF